ncbi:type II secretion system minor pseudopilin GspI [Azoarcus indigens]|uniref:Type II secretion system protein I n=1 Tax=Azoarcus indigens TaxID=29545 RepID=A0A4R6EC72_9RHOO|nr:type II secretion system minor pseudopilin GspI [Azoarcus indigens]NMG64151.1 type II secretion system minor pseudopilin GspI [Azoarcus indigens]TDN55746.1 type II secretion system protein I (GspI) [Azoarcus indigens]
MRTRGGSGFTLIEVLIALAIASVALAAFMRLTGLTTSNLGLLEQQTLAMLSAENALAELQLRRPLPAPGNYSERCPQAGLRLVCSLRIAPAVQGMREVGVEVRLEAGGGRYLAALQTRLVDDRQ